MIETGEGWAITLSEDLTAEHAEKCLSKLINMLAEHPNFNPLELQGIVMGAAMEGLQP